MTAIPAISPIGEAAAPLALQLSAPVAPAAAPAVQGPGFAEVLMAGLHGVDQKVATAEKLVERFAVDDSVPVHQVVMALEQARGSVELAMQVRARLVEGYRELMNMQL